VRSARKARAAVLSDGSNDPETIIMKLSRPALAALAAFVFGCSAFTTASSAVSPCQVCYDLYNRCMQLGQLDCDYQRDDCLRRRNCPLQ
jgi:hypothetical protein